MEQLLKEISQCRICAEGMSVTPRPVLSVSPQSKIIVVGQAPGSRVYESGKPWDDKSGENLRKWLGVSDIEFYDNNLFGILPMGFCYPGKGKSGDLPPRKECAPLWHNQVWENLQNVELVLLIGQYAQNYYLEGKKRTLTETVRNFTEYLPAHFALPHPSPRNNIWMKKNQWFGVEVLPVLSQLINKIIR